MRKALTAKAIDALKPQAKRYEVHDALCPGFSVRVSPQGQKTFNVKYRYGIRQRRLKLGVYPRISLGEAREQAMAALRQVDDGIDPHAVAASSIFASKPSARISFGNMQSRAIEAGGKRNAFSIGNS